jgi:nucleotide-binding universal stress UspA family protein
MKIFAYIDRSPIASSVCQHAAWAAQQLHATVEIIHAIDQATTQTRDYSGFFRIDAPETVLEERVKQDEAHNRLLIEEGRLLLDAAAESLRGSGVAVEQRLFQGSVLQHLERHHADATLVVIGKRGEGTTSGGRHLGKQVERIVRSAHRPVLVAAQDYEPIERVLLAWDGGKSVGQAIHYLSSVPLLAGVPVTLLTAAREGEAARAGLKDVARHLTASGLELSTETRKGDASTVILDAATELEADLIVMGAYGHSRMRELIVGSTTTEVLLGAQTSVMVFH